MTQSKNKTICHYFVNRAKISPKKTAILKKDQDQWIEISWEEYNNQVLLFASGLSALGVRPGDKVAIMANTRFEWSVTDFAVLCSKAITIPVYQTLLADDLKYILNNSETKVLVLENRSLLKTFLTVKDQCPTVQKVICMDEARQTDEFVMTWDELMALGSQEKEDFKSEFLARVESITLDDIASILYTSGTTGNPKGVVLAHEQIMSEVGEVFPLVGITDTDTTLSFLPYAHILGRIEHWGQPFSGYTLAYAESIEKIKGNLAEVKPTFLVAVPRIFEKIYAGIWATMESQVIKSKLFRWALSIGKEVGEHKMNRTPVPLPLLAQYQLADKLVLEKIRQAVGGRLRFAVSGGAPLARDIALFFHACGILILEGYGLTETTAAVTANSPFDYRFGTVGKPIGDTEIKIAADGEILVRSKKVMREYYKNPEATKEAMDGNWFKTGDIGEFTDTGDLKITDRKKDLIKTAGGKYVAPQKLENLLKLHNFVSNVLIHGDQKKYIVALITLDAAFLQRYAEEKNIPYTQIESITQHPAVLELVRKGVAETNTQLANFETIKRFAVLPKDFTVESGELTPSLKVKRKLLDKKYEKHISALYS